MSKNEICYGRQFTRSMHLTGIKSIDMMHTVPWVRGRSGQCRHIVAGWVAGEGLYTHPHWSENATIYV
jgi:hypothetical protein